MINGNAKTLLEIRGLTATVSGSGNVATYTIEKLNQLGAKVLTASDSHGFVHDPDGIDLEKLAWIKEQKEVRRGRIALYVEEFPRATYHEGKRPWNVPCDMAFPSATQNEIDIDDADALVRNGVRSVSEGANMPSTLAATKVFLNAKVLFGPGKAANAGGVAVSGLEQTQNALRLRWTREEVDQKLKAIMQNIHAQCVQYGQERGTYVNYVQGANVGGFVKVAEAMLAYGTM